MLKMVLMDTNRLPRKQLVELEARLRQLGELVTYSYTTSDEVLEYCADAEIILVNKAILGQQQLHHLSKLRYVVVVATGYDNVDVAAANKNGIKVSNVPNYCTISVAQHTIALLLDLTNQVGRISAELKQEGKWHNVGHKSLELAGLTFGVVGFGNIAQAVIPIVRALGMKVIVLQNSTKYTDLPVTFVDKETLFKQSDVISLHCPLTPNTHELVNQETLAWMKPSALIINTARGGLINEDDLYTALSSKQIMGAALDVLNQEPVDLNNPLLKLSNCVITPHSSWLSEASLQRWLDIITLNVVNYTQGKFINLI